jgi:diaminopimelate epimerase
MRFTKAHAYGNDFLYVEEREVQGCALSALAREMCDRHTGVGADGLIVFVHTHAGARMRLHNADGSHAGVWKRCARTGRTLLRGDDRSAPRSTSKPLPASNVSKADRSTNRPSFRTAMGLPADLRQTTLMVAGEAVDAVVMNFGNPQCVVLGPQPAEAFHRLGASIERHELFPHSTNVEFATVEFPASIRILVGSAELVRPLRPARAPARRWSRPQPLAAQAATSL